jgi:hypothetical protein
MFPELLSQQQALTLSIRYTVLYFVTFSVYHVFSPQFLYVILKPVAQ